MKKIVFFIIVGFFSWISVVFADISDVILNPFFEGVNGSYTVEVEFLVSNNIRSTPLVVSGNSSTIEVFNVDFVDGYSKIYLENLQIDRLATSNLVVNFEVPVIGKTDVVEFNSVAYSIKSQYSESVLYPVAENLDPDTVFTNTVTINSAISVDDITISNSFPVISDGLGRSLQYAIDLNSTINVSEAFYINSQSINESFSWQLNSSSQSLYTLKKIGIGMQRSPFFDVDISGALRADDFLLNKGRLGAFQEWKLDGDNLYFNVTDAYVGLGKTNPVEMIDVNGALNLIPTNSNSFSVGTLFYHDSDYFYGVINEGGQDSLVTLNSLSASGKENYLALFNEAGDLIYDDSLYVGKKDVFGSGIEFLSDQVPLKIVKPADYVGNIFDIYKNEELIVSMNNSGELSYIQSNSVINDGKLHIGGEINASKFYLDGAPIEFRLVSGEIFLRSIQNLSKTRANIYYKDGNVAIGKFNPTSNLEIQAPYKIANDDLPTKDAAISFSFQENNVKYTMGVDSSAQDKFLIESGISLGSKAPLMSIRKEYLSIGLDEPRANLHVSGNTGLLLDGVFGFFDSDFPTDNIQFYQDAGNRFFFNSYNNSFRVGSGTTFTREFENVGFHTVDFGNNNLVKGNYSSNFSGYNNSIDAINAVNLSGHSNVVSGEFSMTFGRSAIVGFQHDGSFVYSSPFYYGYEFENEFNDEIEDVNSFQTSRDRQFLIGSPLSSAQNRNYLGMSMGVNTTVPGATLGVAGKPVLDLTFQDELNVSSVNARKIFDSLVNQNFISNSSSTYGYVLVPKTNYFNDYYTHVTFNLIVSLNSNEIFTSIVDMAKEDSLANVSDSQLNELLPTSDWKAYYTADSNNDFANLNAAYFYGVYKNNKIQENSSEILYLIRDSDLIVSNYSQDFVDYCETELGSGTVTPVDTTPDDGIYDFVADYVNTELNSLNNPLNSTISTFDTDDLINIVNSDVVSINVEIGYFDCAKLPSKNVLNSDIISFVTDNDVDTMAIYNETAYNTYLTSSIFPDLVSQIYSNINNLDDISLTSFDSSKVYYLSEYNKDVNVVDIDGNNITTENILDVLYAQLDSPILTLKGIGDEDEIKFLNSNSLSFGFDSVENADLAISENMMVNPDYKVTNYVTDLVDSRLSLFNPSDSIVSSNATIFEELSILIVNPDDLIVEEDQSITPNFVMDVTGNVGLGVMTNFRPPGEEDSTENYKLIVYGGSVVAEGFVDSTTGAEMQGSPPIIIYDQRASTDFGDGIERMVFVSGNAGIGTLTPGSLLSLSKKVGGNNPIITFDLLDTDMFEVGLTDASKLRLGTLTSSDSFSALNVLEDGVSFMSNDANTVSGNMLVTDFISVSTDNMSEEFMTSILNTTRMFIASTNGYQKVSASGLPWDLDSLGNPYLNDGTKIGVGTSLPDVDFHVTGNLNANKIIVSDLFKLKLFNLSEYLGLVQDEFLTFKLLVDNNKLFLSSDSADSHNVSDTLSKGYSYYGLATLKHDNNLLSSQNSITVSLNTSIPVMYGFYDYDDSTKTWSSNDTYFDYSEQNYEPRSLVSINGILKVELENVTENKLIYSNFVVNESYSQALAHDVKISSNGDFWDDTYSYTPLSYSVTFNRTGGLNATAQQDGNIEFIGLRYHLSNYDEDGNSKTLIDDASAIGLEVDVTNVQVQESGDEIRAFKYPAIFMGDVGIGGNVNRDLVGLSDSDVILEVKGGVQATGFVSPNVIAAKIIRFGAGGNAPLFMGNGRVGIGTKTPEYALEVDGDIYSQDIKSGFIKSESLDVGNSVFTVGQNGVGFGKQNVSDSVSAYFFKEFLSRENTKFVYKGYLLEHNQNYSNDVTLLDIDLSTFSSLLPSNYRQNFIGGEGGQTPTVIGLNLDLSEVVVTSSLVSLSGLNVAVTNADPSTYSNVNVVTPNAAAFLNGSVVVGATTQDEDYELYVDGNLKVNMAYIVDDFFANPNKASFSKMVVTDNSLFSGNVTMNMLYAKDLTYDSFDVSDIDLSDFNLHVNNDFVVEATLTINNSVSANMLISKDADYYERGFISRYLEGVSLLETFETSFRGYSDTAVITKYADVTSINIQDKLYVGSDYFLYNEDDIEFNRKYLGVFKFQLPSITNQLSYDDNNTWNTLSLFSDSSALNSSVGVSFKPFSKSNSEAESWSIISKLTKEASSETSLSSGGQIDDAALNLMFINSTYNMVINDDGNIALNLKEASSTLNVNGAAYFTDDVNINGNIYVSSLNFTSVYPVATTLSVMATANLETVTLNSSLAISNIDYIPAVDDQLKFYYFDNGVAADIGFNFIREFDDITVSNNLSTPFNISADQFVYFNNNKVLESMPIYVTKNSVTGYNKISYIENPGATQKPLLQLTNLILADTVFSSDLDFSKINVDVAKRNTNVQNLVAKKISIVSKNISVGSKGESFVGINVDMSDLISETYYFYGDEEFETLGKKYAALFDGGSVVISSVNLTNDLDNSIVTRSNLYVYNKDILTHVNGIGSKAYPSMIVESNQNSTNFEWFVSGKGNTSVGTGIVSKNFSSAGAVDLDAQFIVSANSSTSDLLKLTSFSGNSVLSVNKNGGLGIGKENISTGVDVSSVFKTNSLVVDQLITDELTFSEGSQWYFDYVNNYIGLNTNSPSAQLHALDIITQETFGVEEVRKAITQKLSYKQAITSNITAYDIHMYSLSVYDGIESESSVNPSIVKGLNIDVSGLNVFENSSVYGLYVEAGTKNALVIADSIANVGIGVTQPSSALDVDGTIETDYLVTYGAEPVVYFDVSSVTVNEKFEILTGNVSGNLKISDGGVVSINTLTFTSAASLNDISNLTGSLSNLKSTFGGVNVSQKLVLYNTNELATFNIGGDVTDIGIKQLYVGDPNQSKVASLESAIVTGAVSLSSISSIDDTFVNVNSDLNLGTNDFITSNKMIGNVLRINKQVGPFDNGDLVVSNNSDLYIGDQNIILSGSAGISGNLAYYDDNNELTDLEAVNVNYTDSLSSLTLTVTSNVFKSVVDATESYGTDFNFYDLNAYIPKRTTKIDVLYGLNMKITPLNSSLVAINENNFVGLNADLTKLVHDNDYYFSGQFAGAKGFKYAGLFNGGAVVIASVNSMSIEPSANLQLKHHSALATRFSKDSVLKIDSDLQTDYSDFVLDVSGNVGINISSTNINVSQAQFVISSNSTTTEPLIKLSSASSETLFSVQDSVGIGADPIGSNGLVVNGEMRSSVGLISNVLDVDELDVESFDFMYLDLINKRVGLGTTVPESKLHVLETLSSAISEPITANVLNLEFNSGSVGHNVDALSISMSSAANNYLGIEGSSAPTVIGLNVDLSNLNADDTANVYGLKIDSEGSVSHNSFVSVGDGFVGINTLTPQYELDVNGTMRGKLLDIVSKNMFLTLDYLESESGLVVQQSLNVSGDLKVLNNNGVSINGTLSFSSSKNPFEFDKKEQFEGSDLEVDGLEINQKLMVYGNNPTLNLGSDSNLYTLDISDRDGLGIKFSDLEVLNTATLNILGSINGPATIKSSTSVLEVSSNLILTGNINSLSSSSFWKIISANNSISNSINFVSSNVGTIAGNEGLYFDGALKFRNESQDQFEVSTLFESDIPGAIAFYSASGLNFDSSFKLVTANSTNVGVDYVLVSRNVTSEKSSVRQSVTINSSTNYNDFTAELVRFNFENRDDSNSGLGFGTKYSGLDVTVTDNAIPSGANPRTDTFIGVNVDLTELQGDSVDSIIVNDEAVDIDVSKYAALFNEGQFAIIASPNSLTVAELLSSVNIPEVEVYVSSNYESRYAHKILNYSDFLVSSNLTDPTIAYLRVNKHKTNDTLMIDIGDNNSNDDLYLVTVSNNKDILAIENVDGAMMFGVLQDESSGDYFVNIGSDVYNNDFFVKGLETNQTLISVNNILVIDDGVLISTLNTTRSAFVDIKSNSYDAFSLAKGSDKHVLVTKNVNSNYVFRLSETDMSLSNDSIKFIVDNDFPVGVGGALAPLDTGTLGGFLAQQDGLAENIVWFGVTRNIPTLLYGNNDSDLVFKSQQTNVLYFSKDQRLGIFNSEPETNLSVDKLGSESAYMSVRNDKFHIDKNGFIGINTLVPSVNFHVDGTLRVTTITAGDGGSKLIVPSVNVSHDTDNNWINYSTTVKDNSQEFAILDSNSYLNSDVTQNTGAYAIKLRNTSGSDIVFTNPHVGLDIDSSGLLSAGDRADGESNSDSHSYSAIFYGKNSVTNKLNSKVVIDTGRIGGNISHHYGTSRMIDNCISSDTCLPNPNYHYQFNVITSSNEKGIGFARFSTNGGDDIVFTAEGDATGSEIQFKNQTSLSILSGGSSYVPTRSVNSASFIDLFSSSTDLIENSLAIYKLLTDKDLIDAATNQTIMNNVNGTRKNVFYDVSLQDYYYGVSSENILARIASFPTQNVFNLLVTYNTTQTEGGSASDRHNYHYPISLSSGTRPDYLQNRNIGMVGFNIITSNSTFEDNPNLFDAALVLGGSHANWQVDPIYYRVNGAAGDSSAANGFTVANGFHMNYGDYLNITDANENPFGDVDNEENRNNFVNRDQHSVTKIGALTGSDATGSESNYMSYKTRFNDMRIGKYNPKMTEQMIQDHVQLYFSGAPCVSSALAENDDCSENNDDLSIGRENSTIINGIDLYNQSKLLFTLAENGTETDVRLQIGYTRSDSSIFKSPFIAGGIAVDSKDQSFVGIGNEWVENIIPLAVLHVKDNLIREASAATLIYLPTFIDNDGVEKFFGNNTVNCNSYPDLETQGACGDYIQIEHSTDSIKAYVDGLGCSIDDTIQNCNYYAWLNNTLGLDLAPDYIWSNFVTGFEIGTYNDAFEARSIDINGISFTSGISDICVGVGASTPCEIRSTGDNPPMLNMENVSSMAPPTGFVSSPYVTLFENSSDENSDLLALNLASMGAVGEANDFVGFYINTGSESAPVYMQVGAIEGSGGTQGGIQFSSPSKDYAEYLLKRDPKETLNPGDVVGVFGGQLSKETLGADHIMVISSSPIIIGNFPGDKFVHLYGLTAFLGQVPVKVIGSVDKGDILIVSGKQDGTAIAIKEHELLPEQLGLIVGRAWESSQDGSETYVNTLIGFPFNVDIINSKISDIKTMINSEFNQTNELEESLQDQLKRQDQLIERLKKALSMVENN